MEKPDIWGFKVVNKDRMGGAAGTAGIRICWGVVSVKAEEGESYCAFVHL